MLTILTDTDTTEDAASSFYDKIGIFKTRRECPVIAKDWFYKEGINSDPWRRLD